MTWGRRASNYQESKELVGPKEPRGGVLPRPSLLQPQAVITAVVVGGLLALFVWLMGDRPRAGRPARWALTRFLLAASFVSAIDPGGLVIYALQYWSRCCGGLPSNRELSPERCGHLLRVSYL